jgi:leucyl aminopeptidase
MVAAMQVESATGGPQASGADTIAIGVFAGEQAPLELPDAVAELLASGEARTAPESLGMTHAEGSRWIVAGLGQREDFDHERARVTAALVAERARELSTRTLCWQPPLPDAAIAAALVEGTALRDYRYERNKSGEDRDEGSAPKALERLVVLAEPGAADAIAGAATVAEAVNGARDLQNRPANDLTPTALAEHARSLAAETEGLSAAVEGRKQIAARGMGAFAAVAQGSEQEPALITLRYEPPGGGAQGPQVGFVGKAVTFDSGGISLKPGAKMSEMKFDMSGGAAVIQAVAAIARLRLPVRLLAVVGATENLPATSSRPPTAARSRSTTPTPRGGWCSRTASATLAPRAPRCSSTWRRSQAR